MQANRICPDEKLFSNIFSVCGRLQDRNIAKRVHDMWVETFQYKNISTSSSIISMLAKCGMLDLAENISYMQHYLLCLFSIIFDCL